MYPNAPVLHRDQTRTQHTLAPSLLSSLLSATPPSLLQLLAVHVFSSFLHWPINHVCSHTHTHTHIHTHTKSCTLCPRESSYRQDNIDTNIKHTHTQRAKPLTPLSAPTCLTHKHFLLPVCLPLMCPVSLRLAAKHLAWNSLCNIIPWYLKNPEKKYHRFHKNIKYHNCFQHW